MHRSHPTPALGGFLPRRRTLALALAFLCLLTVTAPTLPAATLLRTNFETANPWPAFAGYQQTPGGGTVTATPTYSTSAGTIDVYGSGTASAGLLLTVNSSAATGAWTAGVHSGVLPLLAANTRGLPFLTLSFSLSASSAYPVRVKIESFDNATPTPARTGGLATFIFPAAPDFLQRFAVDLDTMTPDGAGTFDPAAPNVRLSFELDSAANGTGWPNAAAHTLRVDNVNLSTPKYYVKPASLGGSDAKDGLTEANGLATVQAAVNKSLSGDNIIAIQDGADYVGTGNIATVTKAGAPDAWIVLKNYPGDRPVLKTSGWQVIAIANTTAGAVPAYVEVRGLTLRGYSYVDANGDRRLPDASVPTIGLAEAESNTNGLFVEGRKHATKPRHIRVADNVIEFCPGAGVASAEADRMAIENNTVRYNCWWMRYAGSGISYLSTTDTEQGANYRMLVSNNVVYGNECMLPWYNNGPNFSDGNGIIIDSYDSAYTGKTLVSNNVVYHNGGSGIHVLKASNTDVVHNTAYLNNASPNLNYGQIFTQSSGSEIVANTRVTNNVLFAGRNQTGVTSGSTAFLYNHPVTSIAVSNRANLKYEKNVYAGGDVAPPLTDANFPNNFSNNTDLGRTANAAGLFLSPSVDPAVADFRLRPAAAARNYALAVPYREARDLARTPRPLTGATDSGVLQTVNNLAYSPIFTPASGNYAASQNVTLASDTAGATLVYTTDGSTPTVNPATGVPVNGTLYTGTAIAVASGTTAKTLKAIAWKSGWTTSPPATAIYTFQDLSAVPAHLEVRAFDNPGAALAASGVYPGTQNLQGLTRTPGAHVRFTTDGTDPTATTGTPQEYRGFNVLDQQTVRYRAFKAGRAPSAVVAATVTVHAAAGNLADGDTVMTFGSNRIRFSRIYAYEKFSAARIFARVVGVPGNYQAAIYADNNGVPAARLGESVAASAATTGWTAFPLESRVSLARETFYWLAIWSDAANAGILAADDGGGTVRERALTYSATWPSTAGTTTAVAGTLTPALYAANDPPNVAPVVNAGEDQSIALPAAASLSAAVVDDGLPLAPGSVTVAWSQVSGPGTVTFGNSASPATTAAFPVPGTYVLRLTATDVLSTGFDDVTVEVGAVGSNPPQVIYRETFGNAGTSLVRFNAATIGWQLLTAASATANVTDSTASSGSVQGGASSLGGRPTNLDNVNAGTSASQTNGYGYILNSLRTLVFTTELPVDRTNYAPTALSWYSHVSNTNGGNNTQSAAVRVNGQWYVVTPPVNNLTNVGNNANFGTSGLLFGTNLAGATWRTLRATPGQPFLVGASDVPLPAGNLEAFGAYFTTAGTSTVRFDTFEVRASLTPLQNWRTQHFTPAELSNPALEATRWGLRADPDGDDLDNTLERALGSDPLRSSSADLPEVGRNASTGALTLTFQRAVADMTYVVEGSGTLGGGTWATVATNPGTVGETVTVTDNAPAGTSPRFLRLRVSQP